MQNNFAFQIAALKSNIISIEQCDRVYPKSKLIEQSNFSIKNIERTLKKMEEGNKKNIFIQELNQIKQKMNKIKKQHQRDTAMAERLSYIALSVKKEPSTQKQYYQQMMMKYDTKKTPEQNLIISIIVRQSRLGIRNSQIEEIANKMNNIKQVNQQINKLVHEQGQQIDIITSQIRSADSNVKAARDNMIIANMYDKGEKVELDRNGNLKQIKQQSDVNFQEDEDDVEYKQQKQHSFNKQYLNQKRIELNWNQSNAFGVIRSSILNRLANIKFVIKSLFGY